MPWQSLPSAAAISIENGTTALPAPLLTRFGCSTTPFTPTMTTPSVDANAVRGHARRSTRVLSLLTALVAALLVQLADASPTFQSSPPGAVAATADLTFANQQPSAGNSIDWLSTPPPAKARIHAVKPTTAFKAKPKAKPQPKTKPKYTPPQSPPLVPLRDLLVASLSPATKRPLPATSNRWPFPQFGSGSGPIVRNPNAPTYTSRAAYHFFMYFERTSAPTDDLIVWLNGGPGASSLFGLFVENGPFQFNLKTGTIQHNPAGWHTAANILFVENPAGVGFSSVMSDAGYPRSIDDVGEHVWQVGERKGAVGPFKWWIIGESFGGMYVPHIASHIQPIHLAGVAVGNGAFFAPVDIPVNWVDYFALKGLLIHPQLSADLKSFRTRCSSELADPVKFKNRNLPNCLALTQRFTNTSYIYELTRGKHCLSTFYDVRVTGCAQGDPTDPYNALTAQYLNRADVQVALHAVASPTWHRLYWNGDTPSYTLLPQLAARNVPVLIYNGDADIICNHAGNELMLSQLVWRGAVGFGRPLKRYVPKGWWSSVGGHVSARGIGYVRVNEAGHMVPFNKPWESLAMVRDFLAGRLVAR
ncbi:Alpha/Beta hydrolase protein [Catenaria anguillulae PL171]|uniref:Alpha/Beta hydrolase protein n=1 Tax=Catenaria anguillulae PL171 TaxID=765915 RepID=A0A1Y2HCW2_9FUNG|nr:Alpha/Beta hydrolase protein [Catenaria anguillulae PL171]